MIDVFLSYTSEDRDRVAPIVSGLEANDLTGMVGSFNSCGRQLR